jgi:hypothetical protein
MKQMSVLLRGDVEPEEDCISLDERSLLVRKVLKVSDRRTVDPRLCFSFGGQMDFSTSIAFANIVE